MSNTKTVLIAGAGVLGVAAVAGLGWRCLRNRKSKPAEEVKVEAPVVPPVAKKPEVVVVKELIPANLRSSGDAVLSAIADMEDNNWNLGTETRELVQPELETVEDAVVLGDKVETMKDGAGKPILSISRPRVVDPKSQTEVQVSPDQAPLFWTSFVSKVRRPDVIELTSKTQLEHKTTTARGFHKCTLDGVCGVMHVTKSHTSILIHLGGNEFSGISTSPTKFNGKGLKNLTADEAKSFLAGR
ncbi:hypothetical protein D3C78_549140 [compost metagenome]